MRTYELVIHFTDDTTMEWTVEAASVLHAINDALGRVSQADAERIYMIEVA